MKRTQEELVTTFDAVVAMGIEITPFEWGARLYRPDPNGVSSPPTQIVEVLDDDTVNWWGEVGYDDTPNALRAEEHRPDDTLSLEKFVEDTLDGLITETLDWEQRYNGWSEKAFIEFMIGQGWERNGPGSVQVRHANDHSKVFDSFWDAAKACIELASEF